MDAFIATSVLLARYASAWRLNNMMVAGFIGVYCLVFFRGFIEIDHAYGPVARRSTPLLLCRSSNTNHSSAYRIVVNSCIKSK